MAINEIEVDTRFLESDIQELKTALEALRRSRERMVNEIKELNTMWRGPANTTFNMQFNVDQEMLETLCDIVKGMLGSMEYARVQYDRCDAKVHSLVSGIKI